MNRPFKDVRPVGPFAQRDKDENRINFGLVVENRRNLPSDAVIKERLRRRLPRGIVRDVDTIEQLQDVVVIKTDVNTMTEDDIEDAFNEIRQYADNNNAIVKELSVSTIFQ